VRVGTCQFTYDLESKAFHTMSLSYSDSMLLTPGFADASALYQVIRSAVIEGQREAMALDIELAALGWGATFTRLRPLYTDGDLTALWLSAGPLSVFIEPDLCGEIYRDMREAITQADLSPDDYMNLATAKEHAC
jgi:hypothetical protein